MVAFIPEVRLRDREYSGLPVDAKTIVGGAAAKVAV